MLASRRFVLPLIAAAVLADGRPPLRVLRTTPAGSASPTAELTVVFDRPVAGSLDYSVDPRTIVRVDPAIPGRLEWRDPITIRLLPAHALSPGTRYTVTVATGFHAMDGARLAEPYTFTFRVRGPTLLAGAPADAPPDTVARFVTPTTRFELVWSAPPDSARLGRASYLEMASTCAGPRTVRLVVAGQRRIQRDDPWRYQQARVDRRDDSADSLRRVVTLVPAAPLPLACRGELVAPVELADGGASGMARWPFRTYGPLRVAAVDCSLNRYCPTGPLVVEFTTPVRGTEVLRHVTLTPAATFTIGDSASESARWVLDARLAPRTGYAVVADTALRDIFGQRLEGNPAAGFSTTGFEPRVEYPYGRLLAERNAFRTLAVQHVNVDTLLAYVAPIPDSAAAHVLAAAPWGLDHMWETLGSRATVRRIPVPHVADKGYVAAIPLPVFDSLAGTTLVAVKVIGTDARDRARALRGAPVALLQVTDLGVHARIGAESGEVWVTGVADGRSRANAVVTLYDQYGHAVAHGTTDADGLARLGGFVPSGDSATADAQAPTWFRGYVAARLGDDRAVVSVGYDPDLAPWRFDMPEAYGAEAAPGAAAVFTDRGIYRPGETVSVAAIVRAGLLGALTVPAPGDSLRWWCTDREGARLADTTVTLSAFGSASYRLRIPRDAGLGEYAIEARIKRGGAWRTVGQTSYRVAEYRPPEFLVDLAADSAPHEAGDSVRLSAQARYLFGAPMARARLDWEARERDLSPAELRIPGTDDYEIGDERWWDDNGDGTSDETGWSGGDRADQVRVFASGTDTLNAAGRREWAVALPTPPKGRGALVTVQATVTDVNRQVVVASATTAVHPAAFYLAARSADGGGYFWTAGRPVTVQVIAVRPGGGRVAGVAVHGTVVRHEWHQVRRVRNGLAESVGEWVSDTVGRCGVATGTEPVTCVVRPASGGIYALVLRAEDSHGRAVVTAITRWASGPGFVPWGDENQFKMDVIPDRKQYTVGDTATVLLASPITDADAWVTVEREGIIEQRRMHLTAGATTIKLPVTEAFVPNAYVSVLVARGRSAPPGALDDPGRPTIRVGYAQLRVTPEVKRLAVSVQPAGAEYRPGDSTRIAVRVRDALGNGRRAEVTVWAVDEGVLSLTGYKTPDPLALLYAERGVGMRLASNLTAVAPQVPEGEKGRRAPGGGGGADAADVLRSRFQPTAFFLTSVVTDSTGHAVAAAKLPDNLTTFRVMAVAATAGDRYGSGQSALLVTRPLLIRPALPRFVRAGDAFVAGGVVNRRAGAGDVQVTASVQGADLRGSARQAATLETGKGREVRFAFRVPADATRLRDSVAFTFGVRAAGARADADRVLLRVPTRPDYTPRAHTIAGVMRDSATVVFTLPAGTDPDRSRLVVSGGSSVLALVRGAARELRVYPYACSEQIVSAARPLLALYRASAEHGADSTVVLDQLRSAVTILSRRQRSDGGIGLWNADDWTTPYLSAYAGTFLADARDAGIDVSPGILDRLSLYLRAAAGARRPAVTPVAAWSSTTPGALGERVAAADYLRRVGSPDVAAEDELVRDRAQLWPADRARLAAVVARRPGGAGLAVARELLAPEWAMARIEGRRATFPDTAVHDWYFAAHTRLTASVLAATMVVDPSHPLIGPLVETLAEQRPDGWLWTTQDFGATVEALAAFAARQQSALSRGLVVRAGGRVVARVGDGDSTSSLAGLLARSKTSDLLTLSLVGGADSVPLYYYLTVDEVPSRPPVTPDDAGIRVERWYERYDAPKPVISVTEGDLVRVRLRITVPTDRPFVVVDDPLPAGLEAIDLSLATSGLPAGPAAASDDGGSGLADSWAFGAWDNGWWSPFDHRELRDDRVVYVATYLWAGTYSASYVARATTPGVFVRPPAVAEEMYNRAVQGRTDGGIFTVVAKRP